MFLNLFLEGDTHFEIIKLASHLKYPKFGLDLNI